MTILNQLEALSAKLEETAQAELAHDLARLHEIYDADDCLERETAMKILALPDEDGLNLRARIDLAHRALDTSRDYASDDEVQAVRSRFFRRAS